MYDCPAFHGTEWLVGGTQVGRQDRRHRRHNRLRVDIPKAPVKLEILVENVGRVNYGSDILNNRKGITKNVTLNGGSCVNGRSLLYP